jgi:GDP-L-fucose synthase
MNNSPQSKIFVAGENTLIGEAILRQLWQEDCWDVVRMETYGFDLKKAHELESFFEAEKPEYVIYTGGKSGGIAANLKYPAELMYDNLMGATHIIHACHIHGVKKFVYLASSCSYPRLCPQPMKEDQLLTGSLEPTNEAYAVAKLAGIKLCQSYRRQYGHDFIVGIPANGFGIHDDFSTEDSHVIGALIRRAHEAKMSALPTLTVWGTGQARREFLFADDIADACLHILRHYSDEAPINLAGGTDLSIRELAQMVCHVVGYRGELVFDTSRPDGMPLKALEASRLTSLGWSPRTSFQNGLEATYKAFLVESSDQEVRI